MRTGACLLENVSSRPDRPLGDRYDSAKATHLCASQVVLRVGFETG